MNNLALVRHGETEWNARGVWTGNVDVGLTAQGRQEAHRAAELLRDITLDAAHASMLRRSQETLAIIKYALDRDDLPVYLDSALNERDYGILTGKNKWEVKEKYGEEQFLKWRRGWDYPIPGGETLRDVYRRVVPYYQQYVLPDILKAKNILISAHGNSLRALIKYLENVSDQDIIDLELSTGEVCVYEINTRGKAVNKDMRKTLPPVSAQEERVRKAPITSPSSTYRQFDIR